MQNILCRLEKQNIVNQEFRLWCMTVVTIYWPNLKTKQ